MSSHDYPVDLVYLWCDSTDPVFRAKREKYAARFGVALNDDNNGDARSRSNDELKYSLRSAELYVPWVRKVFICIDDDQTPPSWLNLENPKLCIVKLGEFIPQEFLPTFNSQTIEHFLWRIPDLSEHFLFANDDMMFGRPLEKDFFFAEDAKPYCRFRHPMPPVLANSSGYRKYLENAASLVRSRHTELNDDANTAMSRWPHHNVDSYLKSDLAKVHGIFRETIIETTLRNPFRADDNIQRCIFSYCGIQSFGWHYRQLENIDHDSVEAHTYWGLAVPINSDLMPGLFCFNDNERQTDYERRHGMRLISGLLLPEPSSFEKAGTAPKPATQAERETIRKELERYCEINDRDNYSWFARMALVRLRKEPILPSDNARISIIIPVHNAETEINDCLASVFSVKEASDIEVICVDDGSADDSVELIQEWTGVAPNLRIVSNDGQGIEAARKTGLSAANGTKIVFLDPAARLMQDSALLHVQGESDIKPAFVGNNIPIVAATDENYLEYTKVLLRSIIATTSCNIDFLIFHDGIAEEKRREFADCFSPQENLSVRFVDMAEYVKSSKDAGFVGKRYPVSCSFRAYAPYVLTEFKKVVYLDIDTIVCRDISELYNTDLGDSLMGCVVDVVNSSSKDAYANFARMHGFVEWDKYFNSGVLLMNFKAFRDCGILDNLLRIIIESSKREFLPDQDALNFVCKGRVKYLDPRWNVQLGDYCIEKQLAVTGDRIWIAHFTGEEKPWTRPFHRYSHRWWQHVGDLDSSVALWRRAFDVGDAAVCLGEGVAVSVIVPIYNAEPYLVLALVSLAAQTLRNIEVICVDDGSTDGSGAICERFAASDSRFRVLHQMNSGGAVARNRGIEEAKGRWLFFADADDFCRPDMLAKMVERGETLDAEVVVAGRYVVDNRLPKASCSEISLPKCFFEAKSVVDRTSPGFNVFAGPGFAPWNKLYSAHFVWRTGLRFHQTPSADDVFFVLTTLLIAKRIALMPSAYYYYRSFIQTSQMGQADKTPTNFLVALQELHKVVATCEEKTQREYYAAAVASCFENLMLRKTKAGRDATYAALFDGGLDALRLPLADEHNVDLGMYRELMEMTKARADIVEVVKKFCMQRQLCAEAEKGRLRSVNEQNRLSIAKLQNLVNVHLGRSSVIADRVKQKDARISELHEQMRKLRQNHTAAISTKDARIAELLAQGKEYRQKIARLIQMDASTKHVTNENNKLHEENQKMRCVIQQLSRENCHLSSVLADIENTVDKGCCT